MKLNQLLRKGASPESTAKKIDDFLFFLKEEINPNLENLIGKQKINLMYKDANKLGLETEYSKDEFSRKDYSVRPIHIIGYAIAQSFADKKVFEKYSKKWRETIDEIGSDYEFGNRFKISLSNTGCVFSSSVDEISFWKDVSGKPNIYEIWGRDMFVKYETREYPFDPSDKYNQVGSSPLAGIFYQDSENSIISASKEAELSNSEFYEPLRVMLSGEYSTLGVFRKLFIEKNESLWQILEKSANTSNPGDVALKLISASIFDDEYGILKSDKRSISDHEDITQEVLSRFSSSDISNAILKSGTYGINALLTSPSVDVIKMFEDEIRIISNEAKINPLQKIFESAYSMDYEIEGKELCSISRLVEVGDLIRDRWGFEYSELPKDSILKIARSGLSKSAPSIIHLVSEGVHGIDHRCENGYTVKSYLKPEAYDQVLSGINASILAKSARSILDEIKPKKTLSPS